MFVKLEEIAKLDSHTAGAVFQDVLLCSNKIWELSGQLNGEINIFMGQGNLRYPSGYNADNLDVYGQLKAGNVYPFTYSSPGKLRFFPILCVFPFNCIPNHCAV